MPYKVEFEFEKAIDHYFENNFKLDINAIVDSYKS